VAAQLINLGARIVAAFILSHCHHSISFLLDRSARTESEFCKVYDSCYRSRHRILTCIIDFRKLTYARQVGITRQNYCSLLLLLLPACRFGRINPYTHSLLDAYALVSKEPMYGLVRPRPPCLPAPVIGEIDLRA
jgi:hypothetical protein